MRPAIEHRQEHAPDVAREHVLDVARRALESTCGRDRVGHRARRCHRQQLRVRERDGAALAKRSSSVGALADAYHCHGSMSTMTTTTNRAACLKRRSNTKYATAA